MERGAAVARSPPTYPRDRRLQRRRRARYYLGCLAGCRHRSVWLSEHRHLLLLLMLGVPRKTGLLRRSHL